MLDDRARHSDELKFFAVKFDSLGPHKLLKKQPSGIVADDQSVRLALLVHEVGVNDNAGAGHVFNDDSRIARNMFAEMPRDGSRIGVVSCAGEESDDQANSLTLVEITSAEAT